MYDLVTENKRKVLTYELEFRRVFGVPVNPYWDLVTGFDVVKFDDEFIKAPDGVSTAQAVEAKYGADAVKLIYALIEETEKEHRW